MRYLLAFLLVFQLFAAPIGITWDPNTEPDLAGYRVYFGATSRGYTQVSANLPAAPGVPITFTREQPDATTVFYAVTAYNTQGLESDYSNEISITAYTPPPPPPKPPAPVLRQIASQTIKSGSWGPTITLGLSDPDTSLLALTTWATTDRPDLLIGFAFTDAKAVRRLRVQTKAKTTGTGLVTVYASDGTSTVSQTFQVTVVPR